MSFKTINNTTPFFEGTNAHALVGHSSYSTTGTTSFTAIHTEVAGQEYTPFGAPATTSGPRRIDRDDFIEDIGGSGAIGEDKLVPVGDALLPMYIILTAYCVVRFNHTFSTRSTYEKVFLHFAISTHVLSFRARSISGRRYSYFALCSQ